MNVDDFEKERGVYVITQISSNRKYVGKSLNIKRRAKEHIIGKKAGIQSVIREFGVDDFVMIAHYYPHASEEELIDIEYEMIHREGSMIPNGFNQLCRGRCNPGYVHSDETKLKMSLASLGKKKSDEHIKNMSLCRLGKSRGPMSNEHKDALSKVHRLKSKTYVFNNVNNQESFVGNLPDFSDVFALNKGYAKRCFRVFGSYKGWTRKDLC